jgi:acetyl esterase/lipase
MKQKEPSGHLPSLRMTTEKYGSHEDQIGDLYLPVNSRPAVICLLHGGFWRMPYGRDQMNAIAHDLVARGFAVWNLEYRRLGTPTGGWPNTGADVIDGIEYLSTLVAKGADLDLDRIALVGHSAGGHLALWAAAQALRSSCGVRLKAVVGEAPVSDLELAYKMGLGRGAVLELLNATPEDKPEYYAAASPFNLLPFCIPQLVIHGTHDDAVPIEMSKAYAAAALAAGDSIEFAELPDSDHMAFLDPASTAHGAVCTWLSSVFLGRQHRTVD